MFSLIFRCTLLCIALLLYQYAFATNETSRITEIPPDDLFAHNVYYGFKFSPSGNDLLFRYWTTDGVIIVVYNLQKNELRHQFKMPNGMSARDISWISDSALAFEFKGTLLRMEADGGNLKVMIGRVFDYSGPREDRRYKYWNVEHTLPKDRANILVESNSEGYSLLHLYNTITGDKQDLLNGRKLDIQSWIGDDTGKPRVGIRKKKDEHLFFWVEHNDKSIHPVTLPNGESLIHNIHHPERNHYFVEDYVLNSRNIFISENATTGFFRVLEIDPKNGKIIRVVAEKDGMDMSRKGNSLYIHHNPKKEQFAGIKFWTDKLVNDWEDTDFTDMQKRIDSLLPDTNNSILQCANNMKYCQVLSMNSTDTTNHYFFNRDSNLLHLIYKKLENRSKYTTENPKPITINSGKTQLHGYLTRASDPKIKNPGVIIMPCPRIFRRHLAVFNPYVQFFSTRGYAVLQANTRGCLGYGKEYAYPKDGLLAEIIANDIVATGLWIRSQADFAESSLFLFAEDLMGSYKNAMALKQNGSIFSAAALFSPPLEIPAFYKYARRENYHTDLGFWNTNFADGKYDKKTLKQLSPFDSVMNAAIPILVASGEYDESPIHKTMEKLEKAAKKNKNLKVRYLKDTKLNLKSDSMRIYYAESAFRLFESAKISK